MSIEEKEAQEKGIAIVKTADVKDLQKERLQALKQLFPEVVNSDNMLDEKKLKELIGENNINYKKQGYELTFAGKSLAKAKADSRGTKVLELNEKQSKNPDETSNVVIRGDNLEVLKILKQNYENKIKMIYIDPPYNTKSDNFIYNDNFKVNEQELIEDFNLAEDDINYLNNLYGTKTHSGWLAFMYPRLKLARTLLKEDGVIFISIDDNEQANLKLLCDEIFGEGNFKACITWRKTHTQTNIGDFARVKEYILVYSRNILICKFNKVPLTNLEEYRYKDSEGNFRRKNLIDSQRGKQSYSINHPDTGILVQSNYWTIPKEEILRLMENDLVYWTKEVPYGKNYLKDMQNKGQIANDFIGIELGSNQKSTMRLDKLLGGRIFDFSKPVDLIKHFLLLSTNTNDIILDFFAGSGTTGHAVMELNKERMLEGKESNLKYILVQIDEKINQGKSKNTSNTLDDSQENDDAESGNNQETKNSNQASYNFCIENNLEPVISSITIERLNRAGKTIEQELDQFKNKANKQESLDLAGSNENLEIINKKIDIGYKVFTLVDEPTIKDAGGNLNFTNHGYAKTQDIIYNMLIKTNQPLDAKVIEIIKDKLYKIEKNCYLIASILPEEKEKLLAEDYEYLYINAYDSNMSLENFLNTLHFDNSKKEYMKIIY